MVSISKPSLFLHKTTGHIAATHKVKTRGQFANADFIVGTHPGRLHKFA